MYTQSSEKVHISPWFVIVFAHKCENFLATGLYAVTSFYFSIQNLCDLSGDNWKSLLKGFVDLVSFRGVLKAILGRFLKDIWVNVWNSIWVNIWLIFLTLFRKTCGTIFGTIISWTQENMCDNFWRNQVDNQADNLWDDFFWMLGSSTKSSITICALI